MQRIRSISNVYYSRSGAGSLKPVVCKGGRTVDRESVRPTNALDDYSTSLKKESLGTIEWSVRGPLWFADAARLSL